MNTALHTRLYQRMKTAIAQSNPEMIGDFEKTIQAYSGSPRVLEDFLNQFGSDNPWLAANNARLKQAIFRTQKELKEEMKSGDRPVHGISASGHELTDQMFVVAHRYDPTVIMNFGSQAITKIMESFGNEKQAKAFSTEGRETIKKERKEKELSDLQEIPQTLDELLKDPSKIKDVKSRQARIKIQSILNLDEELKKRLLMLDKVIYGNTSFINQQSNTYMLASEKPGTFFGWFHRNKGKLSITIRDMYTTIKNPTVELEEQERRHLMGSLIAYAATHIPVNRESAIGGYQKDLDFIMQLPENHELIEKYGKPDLTRIRDILSKPEITLIEATRVFNEYPIDDVRKEINKSYYEQFKDEANQTINDTKNLFIENGKWLEDSYGISVPMGRLKETQQGIALSRDDFAAARDMLRIKTLTANEEKALKALTLQDFKRLTDGLVIGHRKSDYMFKFLQEREIDLHTEEGLEQAKKYKGFMLRGNKYNMVENFELENGISLDEFVKRADAEFKAGEEYGLWDPHKYRVKELLEVKLYPTDIIGGLTDLIEEAKQMTPMSEVVDEIEGAKEVYDHKLLTRTLWMNLPYGDQQYVRKTQLDNVTFLLRVGEEIKELTESYNGDVDELMEQRNELKKADFYSGNLKDSIKISRDKYSYLEEPTIQVDDDRRVRIIDVNKLEEHVDRFKDQYVKASDLSDEWLDKASYLVSFDAEHALRKQGIGKADRTTYGKIKYLDQDSYFHEELVNRMSEVYDEINEATQIPNTIKGHELTTNADIIDNFTVNIYDTPFKQKDEFKYKFRGFGWNKEDKCWTSRRTKGGIAELVDKAEKFNEEYHSKIRLEIERA